MDETLLLPLTWKGAELSLPLQIVPQGYQYRFIVRIGEVDVIVERDDAGDFRALINDPDKNQKALPDTDLIEAVVGALQQLSDR